MSQAPEFQRSEFTDSIHYADLFTINGNNWAIMGHGKSTAARHASKKEASADLGRDCLAFFMINNRLYGRYDPGMIHKGNDNGLFAAHRIDFIAYCLPDTSTKHLFDQSAPKIVSCSCELLAAFSAHHPYPAYMLPNEVTPNEWNRLCDPERRALNMLDLLQKALDVPRLLIPWMESVEEKAELYLRCEPSKIRSLNEIGSERQKISQ